jgi:uncharacterized protein Yka (UPF0111/DUF47 family)
VKLQSLISWLLPKEEHFYDFLEQQARIAAAGAKALRDGFRDPNATPQAVCDAVQALEHDGDRLTHEMEEALAKTFVTPLDREDLQRLSMELDDIIDRANGAARACVLFAVDRPTPAMVELMEVLVEATDVLAAAIPSLRKHAYPTLMEANRSVRALEKRGDSVYRSAISRMFHDPAFDAKEVLREREVLEDLESAIDHCDHVASTLTHLAVKHG